MALQRIASVLVAVAVFAQHSQDVSAFTPTNHLSTRRCTTQGSNTSIQMSEPSAAEKAVELRKKAEDAKRKAEELKRVAEEKAEKAMIAVNKAKSKGATPIEVATSTAAKTPTPPSTPVTPTASSSSSTKASTKVTVEASDGAIIPLNKENIEFTSGILGGALALAFGASPVLAVVAAATANYLSKKDDLGEINEFVNGLSSASLNTFNWFAKLDSKYSLLGKAQESLDQSLQSLKESGGENAETVKKIEETVTKTTKQIQSLADEIDLLEGGKQALGAVGDVLETSIDKAAEANKEYKLTDRAAEAAKKAVNKVKEQ